MEYRLEEAVNPKALALMPQIYAFIEHMRASPNKMDRARRHFEEQVDQDLLSDVIVRYDNFYVMRLLNVAGADYFLQYADDNASLFVPNETEGKAYQIPEIVLSTHHEPMRLASKIGKQILWPIFHLMYGSPPDYFSSIQLARYSDPENLGTGWHCDESSEASCVVSLSPERHTGGGTMLMPYGVFGEPYILPSLPKGDALMFNGRTTLHRGLEVVNGERNLLVYWMTNNN